MPAFKKKVDDRKILVKRLSELLGEKAHYNGVPGCTYSVGAYTIERDGTITVEEDNMDQNIIHTLAEEELIEAPETEQTETFPIKLAIELPLEGHTGISIRNLVSEIYSRGKLINKAIGSSFAASEDLVQEFLKDENTETLEKAITCIQDHSDCLSGIEFADDKIRFTGLPEAKDADEVKAFTDLASLMVKAAKDQKRVMAKEVDDSNEKYITRIWLLRLGMKGSEFKTTRKVLLQNLSGHVAFRTQEQIEAAREKLKAKRAAAKEAEEVASDEVSE